MVCAAEAQGRDAAEEHLDPGNDGHDLPEGAVGIDKVFADFALDAFFKVQAEIDAEPDLDDKEEVEAVCE